MRMDAKEVEENGGRFRTLTSRQHRPSIPSTSTLLDPATSMFSHENPPLLNFPNFHLTLANLKTLSTVRILLIGKGDREHALAWRLSKAGRIKGVR
jgi:hypothetical protein